MIDLLNISGHHPELCLATLASSDAKPATMLLLRSEVLPVSTQYLSGVVYPVSSVLQLLYATNCSFNVYFSLQHLRLVCLF